MKRCPECRRDYYDDSLLYCLDDGSALLEGPGSADEPATAILSEPGAVATGFSAREALTRHQIHTTEAEPHGTAGDFPKKHSFSAKRAAKPLAAIGIFAIVLSGFAGYRYFRSSGDDQINSIAVLPFENRSNDPNADYLSDGLAESLIYRLSQLPNLKVSPTSSVMRYKDKGGNLKTIADELDVQAVMTGKLVQRGEDLTISIELVDVGRNKLLWGEQYDRKMSDLLATQREIATAITQKLQLKLVGDEKGIIKKYTNSNEAYQLYLKGRYHFAKRTKGDTTKAIEYFRQAIILDPSFALAYARLADVYNQMPSYPYLSPQESYPQAKAAATKAIEIDPTLSEARTALANTLAAYEFDWAGAEREFKRGIELDPNSLDAHLRYGQLYLMPRGMFDQAVAEINRALEIDPLDLIAGAVLARNYLYQRRYDRSLEQAKKMHEMDQSFPVTRWVLSQAYNANEMYSETVKLSEETLQNSPNNQAALRDGGYAYAKSGRRDKAEEFIARFREIERTGYAASYRIGLIYAALGEKDKAFAELEKALEARDWDIHQLKVDPIWDPLRDDPRFEALLKRMKLPE